AVPCAAVNGSRIASTRRSRPISTVLASIELIPARTIAARPGRRLRSRSEVQKHDVGRRHPHDHERFSAVTGRADVIAQGPAEGIKSSFWLCRSPPPTYAAHPTP